MVLFILSQVFGAKLEPIFFTYKSFMEQREEIVCLSNHESYVFPQQNSTKHIQEHIHT